jgi:hypothetical protein
MSYYIYSTLANNMTYVDYHPAMEGLTHGQKASIRHQVTIEGKVGVANKNLVTPRGAVTKVNDEDFAMLKDCVAFQDHVKNGFISFEKRQLDVDKVISGMKPRDVSAPITPDFYKDAKENDAVPEGTRKKRG